MVVTENEQGKYSPLKRILRIELRYYRECQPDSRIFAQILQAVFFTWKMANKSEFMFIESQDTNLRNSGV